MNHIKVLKKKKYREVGGRGGGRRGEKRRTNQFGKQKHSSLFLVFHNSQGKKTKSEPIPLVIRKAADFHTTRPQPLTPHCLSAMLLHAQPHALQVVLTEQNKELRKETYKTCPVRALSFTVGVTVRLASERVCFGTRRCNH